MVVKFDSLNRFERPQFYLCKPGSYFDSTKKQVTDLIGIIPNTEAEEIIFNFNEMSNLNFRANLVVNSNMIDSDTATYFKRIYDMLKPHMLIFVEDIGFFKISNINETRAGQNWFKDVEAESIEKELELRNIPYVENNTYRFYDLVSEVVNTLPIWEIEHIDEGLTDLYRTFEDVDVNSNCLGFLMDSVQDAYECIFIFDIISRKIYCYSQDTYFIDSGVYISNDDVIESLNIAENSNDICTALAVSANDDLLINPTNPLGTNVFYDFTYYLDWMSDDLKNKVEAWQNEIKAIQTSYFDKQIVLDSMIAAKSIAESKVSALESIKKLYEELTKNIKDKDEDSPLSKYDLAGYNAQLKYADEKEISEELVKTIQDLLTVINKRIADYNKEISDIENEQMIFEISNLEVDKSQAINLNGMPPIDNIELKGLNGLNLLIDKYNNDLSGIVNTLSFDNYFTESELSELNNYIYQGNYNDEYTVITDSMGVLQKKNQLSDLYNRVMLQLSKVSNPIQSFSVDVDSFIFSKDFEPMSEALEPGCIVNVELKDDELGSDVAKLLLTQIAVNYYDHNMSLSFGNRYNKVDVKSLFKDALGNITRTSNSVQFIKDNVEVINKVVNNFDAIMDEAIRDATDTIRGQSGGYVVMNSTINSEGKKEAPYEILIMDSPDILSAEKLWRWNSGGLGYSSTGYYGNYGTAITNDGQIVANFITAGTLNANIIRTGVIESKAVDDQGERLNKSRWNLKTGELVIDGAIFARSLTLGDGVSISASNVAGIDDAVNSSVSSNKNIITKDNISDELGDYVKSDSLKGALQGYISGNEIDISSLLTDYAKTDDINDINVKLGYAKTEYINNELTKYLTETKADGLYISSNGELSELVTNGYINKNIIDNLESGTNNTGTGIIISKEGLLKASNAVIWGTIYASAGLIAGWTIGSDMLSKGTIGSDGGLVISPDGYSSPITINNTDVNNVAIAAGDKFAVTTSGALHAKDVVLSGNITSESGTIAGWQIVSNAPNTGDETPNGFWWNSISNIFETKNSSDEVTGRYVTFLRGNTSSATANSVIFGVKSMNKRPDSEVVYDSNYDGWNNHSTDVFKVTRNGKLYAAEAEIKGKIEADSGSIGGFAIDSDAMWYGDEASSNCIATNERIWVKPSGNSSGALIAGNSGIQNLVMTIGSGFGVTKDGKMYSNSGNIAGWEIAGNTDPGNGFWRYSLSNISIGTDGGQTYRYATFLRGNEPGASINTTAIGVKKMSTNYESSISNWENATYAPYVFKVTRKGRVEASDIKITGGEFNINNNFTVSTDGVLTATGATISGTVTANSGDIAGWKLTGSDNSESNFWTYSLSNIIEEKTSGIVTARYVTFLRGNGGVSSSDNAIIGVKQMKKDSSENVYASTSSNWSDNSKSQYNFRVRANGDLYARNADISGTVTVTGGSLNINNNFQVSTDGELTATGADISGKITASSGIIGGWKITSTYLESDKATDYRVRLMNNTGSDSSSSRVLYCTKRNKDGTFHATDDDTFSLTRAGKLTCSNVDITGGKLSIGGNFKVSDEGECTASNFILENTLAYQYKHDGTTHKYYILKTNSEQIRSLTFGSSSFFLDILGKNVNIDGREYASMYAETLKLGNKDTNIMRLVSKNIYQGESGTAQLSDIRYKNSIVSLDETREDFFSNLNPVNFKYNNGNSGRTHTGFIAQQVKEAANKSGLSTNDLAAYVEMKDDEDPDGVIHGLRYEEFIALNTHMIQKLMKKVESLENEISTLKQSNNE